jgi:hypothetical protein
MIKPSALRNLVFFIFTLATPNAFSATHTVSLSPDSGKNGYEGQFTFSDGIRNCYGEISAAFGSPNLSPTQYHYEGKSYTPADLGLESFPKKRPGGEIEADLYDGEQNLGHLTFKNVTFFSAAGCFTETYHITKMLGLPDVEYRKKVDQLSLRNFSIKARTTDRSIELKIRANLAEEKAAILEKQKAEQKASELDQKKAIPKVTSSSKPLAGDTKKEDSKSNKNDSKASTERDQQEAAQNPAVLRNQEIEREKNRIARETITQTQVQVASDQQKAQALSDGANGVFAAAIAAKMGIGAALISTNSEPIDSPFHNNLIGMTIGKTKNPELHPEINGWTSGTVFTFAFNMDSITGEDPTPKSVSIGSENVRRWNVLGELKWFGNFPALKRIQPVIGLGLVSYRDYTAKLVPIGSKVGISTAIGMASVGEDGWFSMGWNLTMNAIDFNFGF